MATQSINLKRGATFSVAGTVLLPGGTWTAASEVKDPQGNLVSNLSVTLVAPVPPNTLTGITLTQTATATSAWPLGPLNCDIRFQESSGSVLITPTFIINVVQEITDV
jgi:hypothetical protein